MPPEDEIFKAVCSILHARRREAGADTALITRDSLLAELGIGSLELLSLAFQIENEFGIDIDTADLSVSARVSDLLVIVDSAKNGGCR